MNIFYLDPHPTVAAQQCCDKHVVKMILESAQMLSTAHRVLDKNDNELLYKEAHKNHPSTKWVRESHLNYQWLYAHFVALGEEYTARYGKIHVSIAKLKNFLKSSTQTYSSINYSQNHLNVCPMYTNKKAQLVLIAHIIKVKRQILLLGKNLQLFLVGGKILGLMIKKALTKCRKLVILYI